MENTAGFVHLHNHTMYSLLDGAIRPEELIQYSKNWGMGAAAITDHGNMFGAVEFYLKSRAAGIKPIIGSEVYVAIISRFDRTPARGNLDGANHLVLLAKNTQGYKNLMKLVSLGFTEGFYYKPRVDKELLRQYSEGLIALSACLAGEIPELLLKNMNSEAEKAALELLEIFGEGNFFLEIQDHNIPEEKAVIPKIAALSKKTGIPLVATNDAHYLLKEHAESHDVLLCISTGKTLEDENRMKMSTDEIYLKSPDEMKELFKDYPEAIENTVRIAEMCDVEIKTGQFFPVQFTVPEGKGTPDDYLGELAREGLVGRYGADAEKYKERLEYELDIIKKMGFSDYFLAIYDCTRAAREMGIPVGTARGSAGGSIVAYSVEITNLDPMRYGLIFERFLNPERVSMPDFDVDYADRWREKMIDYVKTKYGEDHVCQIITFGSMKAKLVVRDVGRVLNMPYAEVDAIAKLIPNELNTTLESAFRVVPELNKLEKGSATCAKLFRHARVLEGLNRHAGTHAAGVVITPGPTTDFLPVYKPPGEDITSQYTMEYVEKIGCLKVDFLGLRTLTVIKDAIDIIKSGGTEVDMDTIPMDDLSVYELMGRGETIGVFQFESPGMREYLRKLKPSVIEDLIAMNALYRPGPLGSNMVEDFINRKNGSQKIAYQHPLLEPILHETYGVIVYQEQVMKIANVMGGFTLGGADQMRRAMGKKKPEEMEKLKQKFIDGAIEKDINEDTAREVFELMEHFAGYGFNKSHSAGYGIIAYQTAWLKVHYPAEFMAANLTSEMDDTKRIVVLIEECRRMGIDVLPPDVNRSVVEFTVDEGNVRFGLGAVKNVGRNAIEAIICARREGGEFASLFDFCSRVEMKALNRRMMESMIMAGAMDPFGDRSSLIAGIDNAIEYAQASQRDRETGQTSLFGGESGEAIHVPSLPVVKPWTKLERLANEKSVLGFWFSGHPLENYQDELKAFSTPFSQLPHTTQEKSVTVGGVITAVTRRIIKASNKPYMVLRVEDLDSAGEVTFFGKEFDEYKDVVSLDSLYLINGIVKNGTEEMPRVIGRSMEKLEEAREKKTRGVNVFISTAGVQGSVIEKVQEICNKNPGRVPLWIKLETKTNGTYGVKSSKFQVDATHTCIKELRAVLGDENVWIT